MTKPLSPVAIGTKLLGMIKRTLQIPVKIVLSPLLIILIF